MAKPIVPAQHPKNVTGILLLQHIKPMLDIKVQREQPHVRNRFCDPARAPEDVEEDAAACRGGSAGSDS